MTWTGQCLLPKEGLGVRGHAGEVIGHHKDLHDRLVGVEQCLQEGSRKEAWVKFLEY